MQSRLRHGCYLLWATAAWFTCPAWADSTSSGSANAPTAQTGQPVQHFDVGEYRVLGNTVLHPVEIERILYPLLGGGKTLADVESARAALEKFYHDKGFTTAFVDIPAQDVTNGIVRLRITEGTVERAEISGARYFSEKDVITRIPAVTAGTVLNVPTLQQQLAVINSETADRSVVPVLKAGSVPGTVDIAFQEHDDLPLHGSLELNNQQTVDTQPLRLVMGLDYANLFGRLDNLSLQYQTSPQQLDQVRVFAGNYAVHPWDSGLQLSFQYINSNSNVATVGALGVLGKGQIAGARLTYPIVSDAQSAQSLTLGADYKNFRNTVTENGTTALDTPINYVNFSLAYAGLWRSDERITTLALSADAGPRGVANSSSEFSNDRFEGRSNYFYLRGDVSTVFKLPEGFGLKLRVAGQGALEPLISNESYSISGIDGVRGYLESEELGDSAIKGTAQLQSPGWRRHDRQLGDLFLFFDAGLGEVIDALPGERARTTLRSWGGGLDLLPGERITGTVTFTRALATGSATQAGDDRVLFLLRGNF